MGIADGEVVLVVAAMAREFDGLRSYCASWASLPWPIDFAVSTTVSNQPWILAANGPGPRLAHQALSVASNFVRVRAAVSIGYAGALDPALPAAFVFAPSEVVDAASGERFPVTNPGSGVLLSQDAIASSASDKAALRDRFQAAAVEMESAAVARWAASERVPFYCVRVISDTASESFTIDFNRVRDRNGRIPSSRVLWQALARPWTRFPDLFRLQRRGREASRALGDYLRECRF